MDANGFITSLKFGTSFAPNQSAINFIQKNVGTSANDVYLISYPKCGHHLIAKICLEIAYHAAKYDTSLEYYRQRPIFNEKHTIPRFQTLYKIDKTTKKETGISNFLDQTANLGYRFIKSHEMPTSFVRLPNINKGTKFIFVIRDSKDTMISYYFYLRSVFRTFANLDTFPSIETFTHLFNSGTVPNGHYWSFYTNWYQFTRSHSKSDLNRNGTSSVNDNGAFEAQTQNGILFGSDNVLWIRYEDLLPDANQNDMQGHCSGNTNRKKSDTIKKIIDFLDCKNKKQLIKDDNVIKEIIYKTSFDYMKSAALKNEEIILGRSKHFFFRKAKVDDWKLYLTKEQSDIMDVITKHHFANVKQLEYTTHHSFSKQQSKL